MRGARAVVGIAIALAAVLAVPAQEGAERVAARSFEVRYRPIADAVDLVSTVLSEAGSVSVQPRLKRIVVQDHPAVLLHVAELLVEFDVPPRAVEVTVGLFLGTDRRSEEAGRHALPPDVARELRGVRETLADFTRWTAYDALGSRAVACVEGAEVTADISPEYRVWFVIDGVTSAKGDERVSFKRFRLMRVIRTADGGERTENLYDTGIVLPAGRDLLLGAAQSPDSDRALFVKLLAKVR